jgi:F0F1-type ATP synthase assembly protein I
VLNSVAACRRLAWRTAICQIAVTLLVALACLPSGTRAALGAGVGGAAMTLGGLVAAWGAFGGGVAGAGMVLGRLLLGMAAKWVVVIVGLYLAIAVWKLPAVPVLAGAALAAMALLMVTRFLLRRN